MSKIIVSYDRSALEARVSQAVEASAIEYHLRKAIDEVAIELGRLYANNTIECAMSALFEKISVKILAGLLEDDSEGPDQVSLNVSSTDLGTRLQVLMKTEGPGEVIEAGIKAKLVKVLNRYPDKSLKQGLAQSVFTTLMLRALNKSFSRGGE